MSTKNRLKSLLSKSGLSEKAIEFYIYVLNNQYCSVADVYRNTSLTKSASYRAFESLKDMELLKANVNKWETSLEAISLSGLIKKLESQQRNARRLITELKLLNTTNNISSNSSIPGIETVAGEKIYEKYHDLSEMKFDTNLVYGDWEDFNDEVNLIPIEKGFIKNRLKNGGNCHLFLTKIGPKTKEIIDYDKQESRNTKCVDPSYNKPVWINAFEGNNLVFIWNKDEMNKTIATLIDSKPISEFYKHFIYTHAV
jgi:hypothetical protein